jgi:maltooligosyltrehalose trehalohydrolase
MKLGARYTGRGDCTFVVWAPRAESVAVRTLSPDERTIPMNRIDRGYWRAETSDLKPGTRYRYVLDRSIERPDPASHFQPEDVHGASEVIDHTSYRWTDSAWRGRDLSEYIVYELHVGTFTPGGTFNAIIPKLDELRELGITALELMPVAQFPGSRNWGYDGVYPYAVQSSYGTPDDFKNLVNECHARDMAVILDVVYNHIGPEGNYLRDFGPYFTGKYTTPWGEAINYDDEESDEVRKFFIDNARYWFEEFHVDALRLDAVHAIYDMSAVHFLRALTDRTEELSRREKRKFYLIAESDLNDTRIITHRELGGYGVDAQWCDDFHHSLHAFFTGERFGYYKDFGGVEHIVKTLKDGFVYDGRYSRFRRRSHGNSSRALPAERFVVCSQNHDQVGNRMTGERLTSLVTFEQIKLIAGLTILSPYIPLLFMGEEYGEDNPFLYFVSHSDPDLVEAVRKGRRDEFREFHAKGEAPDPQDAKTFERSRLDHAKKSSGNHKLLLSYYTALLRIRREHGALSSPDKTGLEVFGFENEGVLVMRRVRDDDDVLVITNLRDEPVTVKMAAYGKTWRLLLDSSTIPWGGERQPAGEIIRPEDEIGIEKCTIVVLGKI